MGLPFPVALFDYCFVLSLRTDCPVALAAGCCWGAYGSPRALPSRLSPTVRSEGKTCFPSAYLLSFRALAVCVACSLLKLKMNTGCKTDVHENFRVASSSCNLQGLTNALKPVGAKETQLGTFSPVATEREFLVIMLHVQKLQQKQWKKLISNKV